MPGRLKGRSQMDVVSSPSGEGVGRGVNGSTLEEYAVAKSPENQTGNAGEEPMEKDHEGSQDPYKVVEPIKKKTVQYSTVQYSAIPYIVQQSTL
jgi:hypothetical protein